MFNELTAFFGALCAGPRSVLACVSGGADSVALVHLLHHYREELGISRLAAAHVNHGLRGCESDGDEAFVRGLSDSLGIEFFCTCLDGAAAEVRDGIEDWARRQRYNFFADTMQSQGFDYAATAHTADDQAETVLMRLVRGTGVRGLRGVLPVRGDGVIRPLIRVERRELVEWLTGRGLSWRTDSSNADTKFRRNYIRGEVMPMLAEVNPAAVQNIAACAESAARAWEIVASRVDAWICEYVTRVNGDVFHVDKAGLAHGDIGAFIAPEALLTLFNDYGIAPSKHHIERVMASAALASGEHLLPGGWKFYPRADRVCFVRQ